MFQNSSERLRWILIIQVFVITFVEFKHHLLQYSDTFDGSFGTEIPDCRNLKKVLTNTYGLDNCQGLAYVARTGIR